MAKPGRLHLLGVDDGPFEKHSSFDAPLVAVLMEGADLVEGVATSRFPVDGDDATGFLADWLAGLRFHAAVQGVVLGGITVAGLGVVDVPALARRLERPVLVVNRRDPARSRLADALRAAGLADRIPLVESSPSARRNTAGVFVSCAGLEPEEALSWVESASRKADLPEPLRVAHLVAAAIGLGSSRGRV